MVASEIRKWEDLAVELEAAVEAAYHRLLAIPVGFAGKKAMSDQWSVKEILGHLIDSASNNHQRFVRLQVADGLVFPDYSQDNDAWVSIQRYQSTPWDELVVLWRSYNLHLARIIRGVDEACVGHRWLIDGKSSVTLGELMVDYLRHLKDHLRHIMTAADREKIGAAP